MPDDVRLLQQGQQKSAEELAASIGEIAGQAATSTDVASRAVTEAQRTVETMSQLASAATRIGEVIGLIQAIAGQTNLLALNAEYRKLYDLQFHHDDTLEAKVLH